MVIRHTAGLHARPAALFVQTAKKYAANIKARNLTTGGGFVDVKSIIMVLTLGVACGHEIHLQAEGADEAGALAALGLLIESNFGEEEPRKAETT